MRCGAATPHRDDGVSWSVSFNLTIQWTSIAPVLTMYCSPPTACVTVSQPLVMESKMWIGSPGSIAEGNAAGMPLAESTMRSGGMMLSPDAARTSLSGRQPEMEKIWTRRRHDARSAP
jgi:hypothetical protein